MGTPPTGSRLKPLLCGLVAGFVLLAALACAMTTTDQRPFCASCHVMLEAATTHKMGTHADYACNDCHTPGGLLSKLTFKAQAGLADFMANQSGKDVPYPATQASRSVINSKCASCHAQTNVTVASMSAKTYCVDCHSNVAHMRKKPVSTRMVAYD